MSSSPPSNTNKQPPPPPRSEHSEEEENSPRPNRWKGVSSTWLAITEQDRAVATSLAELRNRDLGLHLFDAFMLRKRGVEARRGRRERGEGVEHDDEDDENETENDEFVPPKSWTAWPLPADEVPREGEVVGPEEEDEGITYKYRDGKETLSDELRGVLLDLTLKMARERWEGREWEEVDAEAKKSIDGGGSMNSEEEIGRELSSPSERADDLESQDPAMDKSSPGDTPEDPHQPSPQLRPVVSLDDERSRTLLRPTINHTLSKLDEVLMALHHTRQTCIKMERKVSVSSRATSMADEDSEAEQPRKRSRGRPRKHFAPSQDIQSGEQSRGQSTDTPGLWRAKKSRLGRPRKQYEAIEGETEEEYLIRIARLQKKPLPAFAPPPLPPPDSSRSRSRKREEKRKPPPKKIATSEEAHIAWRKKLGLRDWSEGLGSAALVGFSPDVIARATQRCADLFGEGMVMTKIVETLFDAPGKYILEEYHPDTIPNFDALQEPDLERPFTSESQQRSKVRLNTTKRKLGNKTCPIPDCPRQGKEFSGRGSQSLQKHLMVIHDMTVNEVEYLMAVSDEEMDGAVHVDRFLKPVRQRGWRCGDLKKRKRGRWEDRGGRGEGAERDSDSFSESMDDESESAARGQEEGESDSDSNSEFAGEMSEELDDAQESDEEQGDKEGEEMRFEEAPEEESDTEMQGTLLSDEANKSE